MKAKVRIITGLTRSSKLKHRTVVRNIRRVRPVKFEDALLEDRIRIRYEQLTQWQPDESKDLVPLEAWTYYRASCSYENKTIVLHGWGLGRKDPAMFVGMAPHEDLSDVNAVIYSLLWCYDPFKGNVLAPMGHFLGGARGDLQEWRDYLYDGFIDPISDDAIWPTNGTFRRKA